MVFHSKNIYFLFAFDSRALDTDEVVVIEDNGCHPSGIQQAVLIQALVAVILAMIFVAA